MKITKEYKGITRKENGDYYISGSIETAEGIEIELRRMGLLGERGIK